ncbi:hypothetical protein [Nocardia wallacei]|uniref:hypothetical protein n=1 Tax=Nocardia wallacei TaxID=480035 RepID=UPI0024555AC6|nr:hypothetical protein [Nocardia wallacei]
MPVRIRDSHLDQVGSTSDDIYGESGTFVCGDHVVRDFAWCAADVGEQVDIL